MLFMGNAQSNHITTWYKIYAMLGKKITGFYSIHNIKGVAEKEKKFFFLNKILSYVLMGLYCRIFLPKDEIVHAHGASGYGLSALLSGKRYIVTVYGSELLAKHSRLYNWLINKILQSADYITVTSEHSREIVFQRVFAGADKVICFHTGVDVEELEQVSCQVREYKYALSIRNSADTYRTREIINAFLKCMDEYGERELKLIVIEGNGNKEYFKNLKIDFQNNIQIEFISGLVEKEILLGLIKGAEFCINNPSTDQLSVTLLEALYFDKPIVSRNLAAYQPLFEVDDFYTFSDDKDLQHTLSLCYKNKIKYSNSFGRRLVNDKFSIKSAASEFNNKVLLSYE